MEELVRALVVQTMGEVSLDDSYFVDDVDRNEYKSFANNLYHQLRGIIPNSPEAETITSKMAVELDRFAHYPAAHLLLSNLEDIIWDRYKEDPSTYLQIVTTALNSKAANDWFRTHRKRR